MALQGRISVRGILTAFALVAFVWTAGPVLAGPTFPALTGRVVDDAGILSPGARQQLTTTLETAEQKTGSQVVVVTLKSLQGYEIDDYGYQLGRQWGIGQKGKNNGAMLVVAPNEHRVRIEVGYGLEGQLTDAQSKVIIERVILPAFKKGDFDGGVVGGVSAILDVIGGEAVPGADQPMAAPPPSQAHSGGSFIWIIFVLLFVFGRGFFWPLLFMGGGWGGGSGFGGGRNDGFSGGGGSFGGGGASGSW